MDSTASTASSRELLHVTYLHAGKVKYALKTALACCLATFFAFYVHIDSMELAPVLAYLFMVKGLPNPNLNWLLALVAVVISSCVTALLLVAFAGTPFLFVALTLLWIFIVLLFCNWFPLPAVTGAMVPAIGIFVKIHGTVGDTLSFFLNYSVALLFAGISVIAVRTLIWPLNTAKTFLRSLAEVYDNLEQRCRQAAARIRSGEAPRIMISPLDWAPFRPLRQMIAPELRRAQDPANPFGQMILACRSLNLRLWFFNKSVAPVLPQVLPAAAHEPLASLLDRCAAYLHTLFEGALHWEMAPPVSPDMLKDLHSAWGDRGPTPVSDDILLTWRLLLLVVQDLQMVTTCHNALLTILRRGPGGKLATLSAMATDRPLIDANSLHAGAKLVIMILLLIVEEVLFGLPGAQQVAFFATFFASTGNLGQQNKTDLVGMAGLLCGFAFGIVAAFFTSRLPEFPLLLAWVLLGEFLAALVFFTSQRYSIAGLQAGLALPFAYLASTGPEWGSFSTVWTRFAGLVVAGCTAIVIHAYLWPVLPMCRLRELIAAALKDTAASLGQLFSGPRAAWKGSPPSLAETVRSARDLLDDARYLPGPDHADPDYLRILADLQEIDANLEYLHLLIGLEEETPLRGRFFQVAGEYADQARQNLDHVVRQFQRDPALAAGLEPIHWESNVLGRWQDSIREAGPPPDKAIDLGRPGVLARCLDQIAQATERISGIVGEINSRNAPS
jgi:hypothetical protein